MIFPKHFALHLIHNEHKLSYASVADSIAMEDHGYTDWVSEEQKTKALDTNECWYIQWYPETPVGFHTMAAADLDVLLKAVNE